MSQKLRTRTYAAAIFAAAALLAALPALAQSLGASAEYCQTVNGHLACKQVAGSAGATGNRPYERWEDGSPARGSGSSSDYRYRSDDSRQFPQSFRAYSNLGAFGH